MIRLQNVLKMSSRRICETSWRRFEDVLKTSWRCLEDVFARRLEDVLKTSWRHLGKTSWRRLEDVLKTSWRRLEDVWTRRIYWSWPRRLEDVLKTSSEDVWLIRIYSSSSSLEDVFWRRRRKTCSRSVQDVFIKTNVCCDVLIICCQEVNLCRRQFMLSYAKISLLMFLWHIFSKALRESGRTLQLRFDGILLVSLKIRSSRTDLWLELRKQADWLTSWWVIYY